MKEVLKSDESFMCYTGVPTRGILNAMLEVVEEAYPTIKYYHGSRSIPKKI